MQELAESIKDVGVTTPCLLRPRKEGGYEMLSEHRRKRGNELAGNKEVPCIIRDYDDIQATKAMILSNNQRVLTPMERANAYKMYLDACVHESQRGQRTDLGKTGGDGNGKEEALKMLGEKYKATRSQILRYLTLADLIPESQKMVREEKLSVTPGAELGKLSPKDQKNAYNYLTFLDKSPSLPEALEMRRAAKDGPLTDTKLRFILDDKYKNIAPEWQKAFADKKVSEYCLEALVEFSKEYQSAIYKAASGRDHSITISELRTLKAKSEKQILTEESIKSVLDPSYKPASRETQDTQPPKPAAPSPAVTAKPSTVSAPATPQAPSLDVPKDSHIAAPAAGNPPLREPATAPTPAPNHTAAPSNGPAPVPPAPPEPPAPKEPGIFIPLDKVKGYFPKSFTPEKMEESIYKVLEAWHKKQEQKKAVSR